MEALLLYDGDCGLCNRSVQFVLDHERRPDLRFAALQSGPGRRLAAAHGIAGLDTLVLIEDGGAWVRSDAALRIAARLRGPWSWLRWLRIVPRPLRDGIYRLVAWTRKRWPAHACRIADAATRARFIW